MEEVFDIFTRDGKYLGTKEKSICHSNNPGFYHKPVWIWIIDDKNEILVQKRAACKKNYPNKWDMPSAGHVVAGESIIDGAIRETYEELGIKTKEDDYKFICEYINDSTFEIAQVYLLKLNLNINEFTLKEDEVSVIKWLEYDEFKDLFYSDDFVPFNDDYKRIVLGLLNKHKKNIIFDLSRVLFKGPAISVLNELNLNKDTYDELKRFFDNFEDLDLGKLTLKEKFDMCDYPVDIKEKYQDFLIHYYEHRVLNMDLIDLIDKLKSSNYKVYILSDNNKECINYYKNHDSFKNIDGWVASCDYQTIKKDGNLFNILLDKYNLSPEECFFIDDKKENIYQGIIHGIYGYIFDDHDDINMLYNDLEENGIKIK